MFLRLRTRCEDKNSICPGALSSLETGKITVRFCALARKKVRKVNAGHTPMASVVPIKDELLTGSSFTVFAAMYTFLVSLHGAGPSVTVLSAEWPHCLTRPSLLQVPRTAQAEGVALPRVPAEPVQRGGVPGPGPRGACRCEAAAQQHPRAGLLLRGEKGDEGGRTVEQPADFLPGPSVTS